MQTGCPNPTPKGKQPDKARKKQVMPFQTRIGAVLHERYEIERIIGQGGYGFIYLAQDQRLAGRYCAVKQVSYDPTFPPAMLQGLIGRNIGVETMDTPAACRTYNILAAEGRRVVVALLIEA